MKTNQKQEHLPVTLHCYHLILFVSYFHSCLNKSYVNYRWYSISNCCLTFQVNSSCKSLSEDLQLWKPISIKYCFDHVPNFPENPTAKEIKNLFCKYLFKCTLSHDSATLHRWIPEMQRFQFLALISVPNFTFCNSNCTAGKTTFFFKLRIGADYDHSLGSNVQKFSHKSLTFLTWDNHGPPVSTILIIISF